MFDKKQWVCPLCGARIGKPCVDSKDVVDLFLQHKAVCELRDPPVTRYPFTEYCAGGTRVTEPFRLIAPFTTSGGEELGLFDRIRSVVVNRRCSRCGAFYSPKYGHPAALCDMIKDLTDAIRETRAARGDIA